MLQTNSATADLTYWVSTLRTRSSRPRPRWRRCDSSPWHDQCRFLRVRPGGAVIIGPAGCGVQSMGTRLGAPQATAA